MCIKHGILLTRDPRSYSLHIGTGHLLCIKHEILKLIRNLPYIRPHSYRFVAVFPDGRPKQPSVGSKSSDNTQKLWATHVYTTGIYYVYNICSLRKGY